MYPVDGPTPPFSITAETRGGAPLEGIAKAALARVDRASRRRRSRLQRVVKCLRHASKKRNSRQRRSAKLRYMWLDFSYPIAPKPLLRSHSCYSDHFNHELRHRFSERHAQQELRTRVLRACASGRESVLRAQARRTLLWERALDASRGQTPSMPTWYPLPTRFFITLESVPDAVPQPIPSFPRIQAANGCVDLQFKLTDAESRRFQYLLHHIVWPASRVVNHALSVHRSLVEMRRAQGADVVNLSWPTPLQRRKMEYRPVTPFHSPRFSLTAPRANSRVSFGVRNQVKYTKTEEQHSLVSFSVGQTSLRIPTPPSVLCARLTPCGDRDAVSIENRLMGAQQRSREWRLLRAALATIRLINNQDTRELQRCLEVTNAIRSMLVEARDGHWPRQKRDQLAKLQRDSEERQIITTIDKQRRAPLLHRLRYMIWAALSVDDHYRTHRSCGSYALRLLRVMKQEVFSVRRAQAAHFERLLPASIRRNLPSIKLASQVAINKVKYPKRNSTLPASSVSSNYFVLPFLHLQTKVAQIILTKQFGTPQAETIRAQHNSLAMGGEWAVYEGKCPYCDGDLQAPWHFLNCPSATRPRNCVGQHSDLMAAVISKKEIISDLFESIGYIDVMGRTALTIAIETCDRAAARRLYPYESRIWSCAGVTQLMYAAGCGLDEEVARILNALPPLLQAVPQLHPGSVPLEPWNQGPKSTDAVDYLTASDSEGRTALHWAVLGGSCRCVQLLVFLAGFTDRRGRSAFALAAQQLRSDLCRILAPFEAGLISRSASTATMGLLLRHNTGDEDLQRRQDTIAALCSNSMVLKLEIAGIPGGKLPFSAPVSYPLKWYPPVCCSELSKDRSMPFYPLSDSELPEPESAEIAVERILAATELVLHQAGASAKVIQLGRRVCSQCASSRLVRYPAGLLTRLVECSVTPLMAMAAAGDTPMVRRLLCQSPQQARRQDCHGWTALCYAAELGLDPIVGLLVAEESGVIASEAVTHTVSDGQLQSALAADTALTFAARHGHTALVQMLLPFDNSGNTVHRAMVQAAENNHLDTVRLIISMTSTMKMGDSLSPIRAPEPIDVEEDLEQRPLLSPRSLGGLHRNHSSPHLVPLSSYDSDFPPQTPRSQARAQQSLAGLLFAPVGGFIRQSGSATPRQSASSPPSADTPQDEGQISGIVHSLQAASTAGHVDVCRELLGSLDTDELSCTQVGLLLTGLAGAARAGHVEVVKVLAPELADILPAEIRDSDEARRLFTTALDVSVQYNQAECARVLADYPSQWVGTLRALRNAINLQEFLIVRYLLEALERLCISEGTDRSTRTVFEDCPVKLTFGDGEPAGTLGELFTLVAKAARGYPDSLRGVLSWFSCGTQPPDHLWAATVLGDEGLLAQLLANSPEEAALQPGVLGFSAYDAALQSGQPLLSTITGHCGKEMVRHPRFIRGKIAELWKAVREHEPYFNELAAALLPLPLAEMAYGIAIASDAANWEAFGVLAHCFLDMPAPDPRECTGAVVRAAASVGDLRILRACTGLNRMADDACACAARNLSVEALRWLSEAGYRANFAQLPNPVRFGTMKYAVPDARQRYLSCAWLCREAQGRFATLYHAAATSNEPDVVTIAYVLDYCRDALNDTTKDTPLARAARVGAAEVARTLAALTPGALSLQSDPVGIPPNMRIVDAARLASRRGRTPLSIAARAGFSRTVEALLAVLGDRMPEPDEDGADALLVAAFMGHTRCVELLLPHFPESQMPCGATALHLSALGAHIRLSQTLRAKGEEYPALLLPDLFGRTALHMAAERGFVDVFPVFADWLLVAASNGCLPLHVACEVGIKASVSALLDMGSVEEQIFSKNEDGRTPLQVAAAHGQGAAAEMLLSRTPEGSLDRLCRERDLKGRTALMLAVSQENLLAAFSISELVAPRSIGEQDQAGNTALHLAVMSGDRMAKLAKYMLDEHKTKNNEGKTPIELAVRGSTPLWVQEFQRLVPQVTASILRSNIDLLKQQILIY